MLNICFRILYLFQCIHCRADAERYL